jgi:hypothetical protein
VGPASADPHSGKGLNPRGLQSWGGGRWGTTDRQGRCFLLSQDSNHKPCTAPEDRRQEKPPSLPPGSGSSRCSSPRGSPPPPRSRAARTERGWDRERDRDRDRDRGWLEVPAQRAGHVGCGERLSLPGLPPVHSRAGAEPSGHWLSKPGGARPQVSKPPSPQAALRIPRRGVREWRGQGAPGGRRPPRVPRVPLIRGPK